VLFWKFCAMLNNVYKKFCWSIIYNISNFLLKKIIWRAELPHQATFIVVDIDSVLKRKLKHDFLAQFDATQAHYLDGS
jgi:hypothetical protein